MRASTRRIRGELREPAGRFPAGTPYSADDPELLLWILACMADSALVVYERYVRSLRRDERDAFWQDYKVIGARVRPAATPTCPTRSRTSSSTWTTWSRATTCT